MKKQTLLIAAAAAALTFAAPLSAEAAQPGWNNIDGTWFYADADGDYVSGEWVEDVYYVDSYGKMVSNEAYGIWSYDDATETSTTTYYLFGEDGKVIKTKGWSLVDETWYWVQEDGTLGSGWILDAGKWYYLSTNGSMVSRGSYRVCDNPDADYADRTYTRYWFKGDGELVTGWYNYDANDKYGDWVYSDANGAGHDGWLYDGGTWYYLDEGDLFQNTTAIEEGAPERDDYDSYSEWSDAYDKYNDSHRYYFDPNGKMVYGWYHYEYTNALGRYTDTWYYTNPTTGVAGTGWVQSGGKWYYVNAGIMQRNTVVYVKDNEPKAPKTVSYDDYKKADGGYDWEKYEEARRAYEAAYAKYKKDLKEYQDKNYYIFDKDGVMVTGWYAVKDSDGATWYYADANGLAHTGWLNDGGNYYYIYHGRMLTNQFTPDGYYVDANGLWK